MSERRRVALKVDCDTFEGTRTGIPNLLRAFDRAGIHASFFFTLGPDRTGRAIRRLFTQKGFLKKMLRSNAVSMYDTKTMLYGTLLPAPFIGKKCATEIRSVAAAGHDVGVHGWDHVHWHDHLDIMEKADVEREYRRAHEVFRDIFGAAAHSSAAPGWHSTPTSLDVQETYDLLYTSNTRQGPPHFPMAQGQSYKTLEIPSTLPTWDESLAAPEFRDHDALLDYYRKTVQGTAVHTLHTEVEGMTHLALFEKLLSLWKADGVEFLTLQDYAHELHKDIALPRRELVRIELPNRGGQVSSSQALESAVSTRYNP